ncbi:MAG TPA: FliM/FliN family flagellar motor switch protein [Amphiplicatus sp.]|nr:FliM/FliN family flagellar motor switch protein [Amphiplicatus sp.]HRX38161.1 FliM/FliN family flagellar motor switch protein [Parvularculaceae bacterium]
MSTKANPSVDAAGDDDAPVFDRRDDAETNKLKRAIFSVPIEVVVSVGVARPLIGELLKMDRDDLLPLDTALADPVELRVKDRVIARGELTQAEDGSGKLGVRLTEIVDISDIL